MPDQSLMTAFVQATGNVNPGRRSLAPKSVADAFGRRPDPRLDFWGLQLAVKYLRSRDGGRTWATVRSDGFKATAPQPFTPQATIALKDGTIVRRVNGDDLRFDPAVPHTAYFQRLAPGSHTWSSPQAVMNPSTDTAQITRVRYLRDGRLIATGNYWPVPADTPLSTRSQVTSRFLLMVSSDAGRSWTNAMTVSDEVGYLPGDEWDTAELRNGDLVAVMRTLDAPGSQVQVRKQGLLKKHGAKWVLQDVRSAPFGHSGHPELLATREGPVLHIATTGIHYTRDGVRWIRLKFPRGVVYTSTYYPRAFETEDGVVHVFGHVGSDDPYGSVNQSIVMDSFRLVTEATP